MKAMCRAIAPHELLFVWRNTTWLWFPHCTSFGSGSTISGGICVSSVQRPSTPANPGRRGTEVAEVERQVVGSPVDGVGHREPCRVNATRGLGCLLLS